MLSRSLQWTACLLTLLALAAPAQASLDLAGLQDRAGETVETVQETLFNTLPPESPAGEPEPFTAADALRAGSKQLQDRAESTVADVQALADEDALRTMIDDMTSPVHDAVASAQDQMDGLLADDEPPAQDSEAEMQPHSSVQTVWPGFQEPVLLFGAAMLSLGIVAWFVGQSATVGAGAAGTNALRDGRKFLPYASPLFTRFEKDTVLGHPKREAIYGTIIGTPGITLQDLCEQSGLSRTAVTHHLRLLEHQHLIVSKRVGRSRHFFENGGRYGRHQKDAYAILHNDRSKDIHTFIQNNPGAIQKDLCSKFDIQASVAHWHVKRLLEANLLEAVRQGRTVSYFPCAEAAAPAYA